MPDPESERYPRGRVAAARRQARLLRRLQSRPAMREVLELVRSRRRPGHPLADAQVVAGPDRDVFALPTQLLARDGVLRGEAADAVARAGFTATPVAELDDRVVRLSKPGAGEAEVTVLANTLGRLGVEASVTYLTPTRPVVMKSTATPELPADEEELPAPSDAADADAPGTTPPVVVVLDTGLAVGRRTDGWLRDLQTAANQDPLDVFPEPNGFLDLSAGHGTFVAGLVQLVDRGLTLRAVRVVDSDGLADEVDVAVAVVQAVREHLVTGGRLVLNLSLGTETVDDRPPVALAVAFTLVREIERATGGEVLVVAAAGNDGSTDPCWPAAFARDDDKVVAVAALDLDGKPATWSSRGRWVACSTLGEAVLSTYVEGEEDPHIDPRGDVFGRDAWAYWTGTSFAAPRVAALVASRARTHGGSLADALTHVLSTGEDHDDGYGARLP